MARIYNFSAGPAAMPEEVLKEAAAELTDYRGRGMSVMEMSHRGDDFQAIFTETKSRLTRLFALPEGYRILFLQGGASLQFAMVAMNLLSGGSADYVHTGVWSKKAIAEARRFGTVRVAASGEETDFSRIPRQEELDLDPNARYCHITTNNTIYGTEYPYTPETGDVPLIADASSNILSRPFDLSRFAMVYAGAQKNLGPAGVCLVILRESLLEQAAEEIPTMLAYRTHVAGDSMFNTPPTFAIYMVGLVARWLEARGGVAAMEEANKRKAALLYDLLDRSDFFLCPTEVESRSRMNIPFTLADPTLDATFLSEAKEAGLVGLKGHRLLGGMRASIYNAMPESGVARLVAFMETFERRRG